MRKILIILFLTCFAFVVYGCKPSMPSGLYSYVELLEKVKLRGLSSDFFIEVSMVTQNNQELCRLSLIASRLGAEDRTIAFEYGGKSGVFQKDSSSGGYEAEFKCKDVHDRIAIKTEQWETFSLVLVARTPTEQLLSKAYSHFENQIQGHISKGKFLQRIQIKILADMHANTFFYVGFIGNDDYYAAVFDVDTLEIIADYYK